MRYLFFFICLPYCVVAMEPETYKEISLKVQSRSGQSLFSNKVGGDIYLKADTVPIPIIRDIKSWESQSLDFKWDLLLGVPQYEIQIARNPKKFSHQTGFQKPLLNKIVSTNYFKWNFKALKRDTLYWAVRSKTKNGNSYFTNPAMKIILGLDVLTHDASVIISPGQLKIPSKDLQKPILALRHFKREQNNISITIENLTSRTLRSVELYYYESDNENGYLQSAWTKKETVKELSSNQPKTIIIKFKSSKKYLTIIPSSDGAMYTNLKTHIKIK